MKQLNLIQFANDTIHLVISDITEKTGIVDNLLYKEEKELAPDLDYTTNYGIFKGTLLECVKFGKEYANKHNLVADCDFEGKYYWRSADDRDFQ